MNIRERPYGDPNNHINLADLLPLKTPLSLMIDPSNLCNFRCRFCPTAYPDLLKSVARPKGIMKFDLFCKIIDDTTGFPDKLKKIHLYKDGEPFLNRNLGKMIAYAKNKDVAFSIETTTNGSLLTQEKCIEIIDAGLDRIRISVEHVNNEGYLQVTGTYSDYFTVLKNVERLCTEKMKRNSNLYVHVKLVDIGFNDKEKENFFKDFSGIADEIHIDEVMGWSDSEKFDFTLGRNPQVDMTGRTKLNLKRVTCPHPFYTLSVNFNGLVSVCCVDWTMNTIVGDCKDEKLPAIWNGTELKNFRLMHLRGKRELNSACRNCQYIQGMSQASDLDEARDFLLKIFGGN